MREVVAGMNPESFVVRPHRRWVEKYADPASWRHLDTTEAGDEWWVDVTLPMLELARRRLRGLAQLIDKVERALIYTDSEDHVALQRLRRHRQLTKGDLDAPAQMLVEAGGTPADIDAAREDSLGLGLFVRSLVGLDTIRAHAVVGDVLDASG